MLEYWHRQGKSQSDAKRMTEAFLREGKVRIIVELARKISERARDPEQSREA